MDNKTIKTKQTNNIKEGYCSTHGYDWCKCLRAMEEDNKYWTMMFEKDKKKRKKT